MNRRVVVPALLGVFVTLFPFLIVVAALPQIARDFGTAQTSLAWMLTLPLILGAVVLAVSGRLGDLFGHRRVFLLSLSVSGVFALLASVAWDPWSLTAFRTISQSIATAAGPAAIALVVSSHDEEQRPRVLGFWAFSMAIAPASGLLVGGPLVELLSWRGLFAGQGVAALAVAVYGSRLLSETARVARVAFDVVGALTFMVAGAGLVFGLDRAGRWGWGHPAVSIALAVAAFSAVVFVRVEMRQADPILSARLMRNPAYLSSCATELTIQMATNAGLFVLPAILAAGYETGTGRIAYAMAPMPIGMALSAPQAGRVIRRLGGRVTSMAGMAVIAGSLLAMVLADRAHSVPGLLAAWFLVGVGNGPVRPALAAAAAATLAPEEYGAGMAATRMVSTIGSGAGITMAISAGAGRAALVAAAVAAVVGIGAASQLVSAPAPDSAQRSVGLAK